jgi:prepilin-type N-terminal cleavage/methylation domain-containing protein
MARTEKKAVKERTGMSQTGSKKRDDQRGFTLFELVIVIFIVTLFLGLVSAPIQGIFAGGDLGKATRMIMSEVSRLRGEAAFTRTPQALILNINENSFYPYELTEDRSLEDRLKDTQQVSRWKQELPPGVQFEDVVVLSKGKDQEGEAFIRFFSNGAVEHSLIHLRNSANEAYTLEIIPLTGFVRIHEGYIEKKQQR